MSTVCVVAARAASTRRPGKVLAHLGGRPMLAFVLERLARAPVDRVVVATTERPDDDAVVDVARARDVQVVRGPEHDVLARFACVLDRFDADSVVRITADCPFTDATLVERALSVRADTGADYVSNTLVRTFPDGLDVEVVAASALRAAAAESTDAVEREHVTPFVYRHPERFALASFRHAEHLGDLRWTVDTPADLERARRVVASLGRADFDWTDVLRVTERAAPSTGGWALVPATPDDADFLFDLRNDPDSVRWSRTGRPVATEEHTRWFQRVLDVPSSRVWIGSLRGERVGQVRIDVCDGVGAVSAVVAPAHRGRGIGTRLLTALQSALSADEQVCALTAAIHPDNEASRRAFARAGFRECSRDGDYAISRWERPGRR